MANSNRTRKARDHLDDNGKYTQSLKDSLSTVYLGALKYNAHNVMQGKCLVVDPSSSGSTSLTAYAVIEAGKITEIGEVPVPWELRKRPTYVAQRINSMANWLLNHFSGVTFDLLAVELLYHSPQTNTVMNSFQKLTMSIGAIHASINAKYRVAMPPWEWHTLRTSDYVKTDLADVELMAMKLIRDSRKLLRKKAA